MGNERSSHANRTVQRGVSDAWAKRSGEEKLFSAQVARREIDCDKGISFKSAGAGHSR
jgi:hypothetical protein